MKATIEIAGVERLQNSKNGTPRWRVFTKDGATFTTSPDSAVNYAIDNSDMRGVPLSVLFNGKGEIEQAEVIQG